jgi:hypothetical protein
MKSAPEDYNRTVTVPSANDPELSRDLDQELAALRKRSVWRRLADYLFGYDFFISYRWVDGKTYAVRLASALQQRGYDCFLDSQSYTAGDDWKTTGAAAIRRTSQLIVVGSPKAIDSDPVLREVRIFTRSRRKVIPIDFGGSLDPTRIQGHAIEEFITTAVLQIKEDAACLDQGPSGAALDALQKAFQSRRQSVKRIRALQAVSAVLFVLLLGALGTAWYALRQQAIAESRLLAPQAQQEMLAEPTSSLALAIHAMRRFKTEQAVAALDAALSVPQAFMILHHNGPVWSAAFSPGGKRVVTSSADGTARVWDAENGRALANLTGHQNSVLTAAFSPDGKRVVTASSDKTARVWDAQSGRELATLIGHQDSVLTAAFSPDGKRVVTASHDKTARVWDADSGRLLLINPHRAPGLGLYRGILVGRQEAGDGGCGQHRAGVGCRKRARTGNPYRASELGPCRSVLARPQAGGDR